MNWDRSRGEQLVALRGSESLSSEAWEGAPRGDDSKAARTTKRKPRTSRLKPKGEKRWTKGRQSRKRPGRHRVRDSGPRDTAVETRRLRRELDEAEAKGELARVRRLSAQIRAEVSKTKIATDKQEATIQREFAAQSRRAKRDYLLRWTVPSVRIDATTNTARVAHAINPLRRGLAVCGAPIDYRIQGVSSHPPRHACSSCKETSAKEIASRAQVPKTSRRRRGRVG